MTDSHRRMTKNLNSEIIMENQIINSLNTNASHADLVNLKNERNELIKKVANSIVNLSRELFCAIPVEEFSELNDKKCPNFLKVSEAFDQLSFHVQLTILNKNSVRQRALAMERWIKIMQHCYQQRDFNSLFAIYSAFEAVPIFRLSSTKDSLSFEDKKFLTQMGDLRKEMFTNDENTIPFIGPYRGKLININESIRNAKNIISDIETVLDIRKDQNEQADLQLKKITDLLTRLKKAKVKVNQIEEILTKIKDLKTTINEDMLSDIKANIDELELIHDVEKLKNSIVSNNQNFNHAIQPLLKMQAKQRSLKIPGAEFYQIDDEKPNLDELSKNKEPRGFYAPNDFLLQEEKFLSDCNRVIHEGPLSLLINSSIQDLVKQGIITFQSNDPSEIVRSINMINNTAVKMILHKKASLENLDNIFQNELNINLSKQQLEEISKINKQIYYHQLILNPVLAEMVQSLFLKSKLLPVTSTLKLINKINQTLYNAHDDNLSTLLKNIGFNATEEQLNKIIAENIRLRKAMEDKSITEPQYQDNWLTFNKKSHLTSQRPYLAPKVKEAEKLPKKVIAPRKLIPSQKDKELSRLINLAKVSPIAIDWKELKEGQSLGSLAILKNNMMYYEQHKYPYTHYRCNFTKFQIDGQIKTACYIAYDGKPLSTDDLAHINNNTLIVRKLSLIGGVLNAMAYSEKYLSTNLSQRERIQILLINLANQLHHNPTQSKQDLNRWIDNMVNEIHKITGIDKANIIEQIRTAERYFVAEYKSDQILINETTRHGKTTVQMDLPYGNVLTDAQKEDYLSIRNPDKSSRPAWFNHLAVWEQDWLNKKLNQGWPAFEKLNQSSAMSQIPGTQNARMNYLLERNGSNGYTLLGRSFKMSTMVPYEMPKDELFHETKQTAEQVLHSIKNQTTNDFQNTWGSFIPPKMKPLIFFQSLLSDTIIGGDDNKLSDLQQKAIKTLINESNEVDIVSGNDPVNFQRWVVPQSGIISQAVGRWDHTNYILNYAKQFIQSLEANEANLNEEQTLRLTLMKVAYQELHHLRSGINLPQIDRNFAAFKAAYTAILVESMGGMVVTNCKSAKDRTGFDELYRNAMILHFNETGRLPAYTDSAEEHQEFIDLFVMLFNSMKAQEAAAGNTPGSFGVKDEAIMIKYGDIATALGESYKMSNKLANMNKPKALEDNKKQAPTELPIENKPTESTQSFWKRLNGLSLFQSSKPKSEITIAINKIKEDFQNLKSPADIPSDLTHIKNDIKQLENLLPLASSDEITQIQNLINNFSSRLKNLKKSFSQEQSKPSSGREKLQKDDCKEGMALKKPEEYTKTTTNNLKGN